jgi:flagellar motility protein MotE (MotC chaperone)
VTIFQRIRILPLLVLVAFFSFAVRVGEFASGVSHFGTAYAETKKDDNAEKKKDKDKKDEKKKEDKADDHAAANEDKKDDEEADTTDHPEPTTEALSEEVKWQDAGDTEEMLSDSQTALYKDLAARRDALEKREKEMAAREALLKAGEREMDQKMRQLTDIRNEIQGLLQKQGDEEKARIASLVKIYEGMKPTEAARILDTLDINILLNVLSSMNERKSSPIMAAMTPERARAVTILMAQQNKLPSLPQ